jgi:hypothetical protein
MSDPVAQPQLSIEEYLRAEESGPVRHELVGGEL